jgi:hypothetical protein
MKWIFVWFGLASIAVAAAASSCSINHRSDRFECERTQDCDPGRTCSEGLCVTTGGGLDGGPIDGGPPKDAPPIDANTCPTACTQCMPGKVCIIDCAAPGANCTAPVVCPTGFNCDIRCSLPSSCRGGVSGVSGVNCTSAASCKILCSGPSACRNVMCGLGRCDVNCTGAFSCETVTCSQSCACDVECPFPNGSCSNLLCTKPTCDTGRGCSATLPTCNTCL